MKVPRCGRSLTYGHPQHTTHLPSLSTFSRTEFAFCRSDCDKGLRNRFLETVKYPEGRILRRVTASDNYDQLLDRALAGITKPGSTGERFELPIASVSVIGARTIVHNFADVADRLNRDPLHILKYLAKEMATAGSFEGGKGYFQGKFSRDTVNRLVGAYSNRFVICPVCHRPDTRVERRDRLSFLVCEACGARSSILTT